MAEIMGTVAGFFGPAKDLGEFVAGPIKRWYNYLRSFNSNIQKLKEEERKLRDVRERLQRRVNRAKNNAEEILPEVNTWIEKTNEVLANMVEIEKEINNIQNVWLTKKFYHFSLRKKVIKTTEAMEQLRGDCNFDVISDPAPPASMVPTPSRPTKEFESRKHIEEEIMTTLKDKKVNMIGICGMGGVGKTTMAKRVMNRVREEDVFGEAVMVVVSQQVDMLKIQNEIGEQLGLNWEKQESLASRAHKLRTRLGGGKRILIVLDDVWKNLKLEDLGIPCESDLKGCTILLTSRDRVVLNEMDAQKVCGIQTLSKSEAWSLFQEKIGTCVDADQNLFSTAQEVMKECKGLPIAIVNVATALKDVKSKNVWDDALEQLKSSNPTDMPKLLEDVYKPLKLSYDYLDSQHAKSLFLLCCLFPEDVNIPLEDLIIYAMGLSMFEGIRNMERVRNRTFLLVERLKSRFLLLDGRDQYHVRMHDVVRDVAIFIASEERRIKHDDCTWISSHLREGIELSFELSFPNLHLLWIDKSIGEELQINDNLFERMTKLNVLYIKYGSLRSLPYSTQFLKNLRTLTLYLCNSLETMSIVGELVNLEILICSHCKLIKELPVEIGRLVRMRLLELSHCEELKTIAPDIISRLIELEKLKMVKSFNKWEAEDNEGKERKNARLRELESLSNLTWLEIEVEDFALVAEEICLSQKIVNFGITIGDREWSRVPFDMDLEKRMNLHLPREITLGNWILKFWSSFEHMTLVGDGLSNLDLEQALQNLRSLTLRECSMVKKLGNTIFPFLESLHLEEVIHLEEICNINCPIPDEGSTSNIGFKNLKELRLVEMPALKHLWSSPYQNNVVSLFSNLSSIYLDGCDSLHSLFSLSMATDCLLQLKRLDIRFCVMMEQVFLWNEEENEKNDIGSESLCGHHIKVFPKLEELILQDLPRLKVFCKGIESINFPLLTVMDITSCPKLKSLPSSTCSIERGNNQNNPKDSNHDHDEDDDSLHLFCKPDEALQNLRRLFLSDCSVVKNLGNTVFPHLESLHLYNLCNLEEICNIDGPVPDEGSTSNNIAFKNLEHLSLGDLPRLKHFWACPYQNNSVSLFNNLSSICLWRCYSLRNLFSLSMSAKDCLLQLKRLEIDFCKSIEQVFVYNEEVNETNDIGPESVCGRHTKVFPKLEELKLQNLPRLTTFCKGIESIKFPFLTAMKIESCPKLKSLVSTTCSIGCGNNHNNSEGSNHDHDDESLHLFCKPEKVAFDKVVRVLCISHTVTIWCHHIPISFFTGLEDLEMSNCNKIKSLFSSSIAENLVNLKKLKIAWCTKMVKVIDDNEDKDACPQTTISLFPRLEYLELRWLFALEMFCGWRCALELPSLKTVEINNCPNMERFSFASLATPNLEEMRAPMWFDRFRRSEIMIKSKDLNDGVQ